MFALRHSRDFCPRPGQSGGSSKGLCRGYVEVYEDIQGLRKLYRVQLGGVIIRCIEEEGERGERERERERERETERQRDREREREREREKEREREIHIYRYICIYVYMYICIYVYMYICIYVYMYMYIHIYTHENMSLGFLVSLRAPCPNLNGPCCNLHPKSFGHWDSAGC